MKTDTESHAMRYAEQLLWMQDRKAERVVVKFETGKPILVQILCTDGSVLPVVDHQLVEMLRALKLDYDEAKKTVAEIKALKRMEDLA